MISVQQKIDPIIKIVIPTIFVLPIADHYLGLWSIFIIIACGFLYYSYKRFRELAIPKKWSSVSATVTHVDIACCQPIDRYWRPLPKIYSPHVAYEYNVRGKQYASTAYSINNDLLWSENIDKIQSKIDQLKIGSQIEIFYNPSCPTQSAIDITPAPYTKFKAVYLLIVAVVIGIIGVQVCYLHYS